MSVKNSNHGVREQYKTIAAKVTNANIGKIHWLESRIDAIHRAYVNADERTQLRILRNTYVYARFTANTSVQAADRAYARWLMGENADIATNYGGYNTRAKGKQVFDQLRGIDRDTFKKAIMPTKKAIDNGNYAKAGQLAQDLHGLGKVKGPFMIALLTGESACFDRHGKRFMSKATGLNDFSWNDEHQKSVQMLDTIPIDANIFMKQWVVFDIENHFDDKHADIDQWTDIDPSEYTIETHDLFYRSILNLIH